MKVEALKEILRYSPKSGKLFWLVSRGRVVAGQEAGHKTANGYVVVNVGGRSHKGHRIAWALMTGEWPTERIDHKDRNGQNNRWSNLRLASHSQNIANSRRRRDNTSGIRGVYSFQGKWMVIITHEGVRYYLGLFKKKRDAAQARRAAAQKLYGQFCNEG